MNYLTQKIQNEVERRTRRYFDALNRKHVFLPAFLVITIVVGAVFWKYVYLTAAFILGAIWLIYTIHFGSVEYRYSDHQVDAVNGNIEVGTVFITTNIGIHHEHGRCYGIFKQDSAKPGSFRILYYGATTFPDRPYRPRLDSKDGEGVTYLVENNNLELVPFRISFDE